jgi:alkyl hydroperoxide reductase subunit D
MIALSETTEALFEDLGMSPEEASLPLQMLEEGESRYIKDGRMNLKNVLSSDHLNDKEIALLGIAIAVNQNNDKLIRFFTQKAEAAEATKAEIGEAVACTSLLASNNVFYRFRHFVGKPKYEEIPARIRMNIMMKPVTGKAFFELMSLAVSAVNGCEMCVKSHEQSVLRVLLKTGFSILDISGAIFFDHSGCIQV